MRFGHERSPEERYAHKEVIDKLYDELVPSHKKQAVSPDSFAHIYGGKAVEEDKAYVRELEEKFSRDISTNPEKIEAQRRGELFEAIVAEEISSSEWFGHGAEPIVPSRFDDIRNGIDLIVKFEEDNTERTHLALAIDVTKDAQSLRDKFQRIKNSIRENGRLSAVKYFSEKQKHGGQPNLEHVPRVIVGADAKTIAEIAEKLLTLKGLQKRRGHQSLTKKDSERFFSLRDELANHPLQFKILNEIRLQLDAFANYAERVGQYEATEIYRQTSGTINEIISAKMESSKLSAAELIGEDEVYQTIEQLALALDRDAL
jgi:hypothetical protein